MNAMHPEYLKKYADRYRAVRGEDGIWNLRTRYRTAGDIEGDVFVHSEGVLALWTTSGRGRKLVREGFQKHQVAEDAWIVLFPESDLHDVADRIGLRRRRQVSSEQADRLKAYRFGKGGVQ